MKNRKFLLSVLLCAVMGMMVNSAMASPYINAEEDQWNLIGPNNQAGRSRTAVFDKFNPGVIWMGTVGGLYVSVNYGHNWQEVALGSTVDNVTAIAQDDDGLLYIGTGEGYYRVTLNEENPLGHSNHTSGKIGSGVYKQNSGAEKQWSANLTTDAQKYDYIAQNFKFTVLPATVPANKYDNEDAWAFINNMAYVNGTLYVGTYNSGLKMSADGGQTFTNVQIGGQTVLVINDIAVNADGRVAVAATDIDESMAFVALNQEGSSSAFTTVMNETTVESNRAIGRIKLTFGQKNPNNLFVMVAGSLKGADLTNKMTGILLGIYRPADTENGINNIGTEAEKWTKISPQVTAYSLGYNLGEAMAINVDDESSDEETIYLGGEIVLSGTDVNGEGLFSFSPITSSVASDTLTYYVAPNIHSIIRTVDADSNSLMFAMTDCGPYRYYYDNYLQQYQWLSSAKNVNTLQSYKIAAAVDGSVLAATQSNAVMYMSSVSDSVAKGGMKIWSVNNAGYPYTSNPLTYSAMNGYYANEPSIFSAGYVGTSGIYRTLPSKRKPMLLSRPGTNVTRTYGNQGDFTAVDDQTWTYGAAANSGVSSQVLLISTMGGNETYDQFVTPAALWESFDFDSKFDSVLVKLTKYTTIHRNGESLDCKDGREIKAGDSVLVISDILGYPFFHVFSATDVNTLSSVASDAYELGSGDVLFYKNADFSMKVPQKVQSRALVATTTGAFICGKIFDFSKTINTDPESFGNLTWARIYTAGLPIDAETSTLNTRIHAVALSQDGTSAFLSVDHFSGMTTYENTELIRISGLNDVDISNDRLFVGVGNEVEKFTSTVIGTYTRQISSIVCDPDNSNNMIITFDGYNSTNANVMRTTNALADAPTFTAMDLNPENSSDNVKPVFSALYEKVGGSGRIYVGSDDGLYYTTNGSSWTKDESIPAVPVYDLYQQRTNLPQWNFLAYTGDNSEAMQYDAPVNRGVMYAATYGKGLYMNNVYLDTTRTFVSIDGVINNQSQLNVTVYPNPASSQATIAYTLDTPDDVTFTMIDMNGREVSVFEMPRQSKGTHTQVLDVRGLQRGVYMIRMTTNKNTQSAKLIVK